MSEALQKDRLRAFLQGKAKAIRKAMLSESNLLSTTSNFSPCNMGVNSMATTGKLEMQHPFSTSKASVFESLTSIVSDLKRQHKNRFKSKRISTENVCIQVPNSAICLNLHTVDKVFYRRQTARNQFRQTSTSSRRLASQPNQAARKSTVLLQAQLCPWNIKQDSQNTDNIDSSQLLNKNKISEEVEEHSLLKSVKKVVSKSPNGRDNLALETLTSPYLRQFLKGKLKYRKSQQKSLSPPQTSQQRLTCLPKPSYTKYYSINEGKISMKEEQLKRLSKLLSFGQKDLLLVENNESLIHISALSSGQLLNSFSKGINNVRSLQYSYRTRRSLTTTHKQIVEKKKYSVQPVQKCLYRP